MITVIGSLNMDLVVNTEKIPRPGETVMGKNFKQVPGGKGGNQADAAAKLGADVRMIGCIGDDSMGNILKTSLASDGVKVDSVLTKAGISTGIASIIVEDSGDNAITVAPGANYELNTKDIEGLSQIVKESKVILLQLEIPVDSVKAALMIGKQAGSITILNPAPAAKMDGEIYDYVDILTPNETELEFLTGHETVTLEQVEAAGKLLIDKGVKEIIVTLGHNGCMHIKRNWQKHYEAYKVKAIDTTAAGDGFNGALAVCLNDGKTMDEAIQFAMKVGAMTVTKEGAQTSLPLKAEVDHFDSWIVSRYNREEEK
ncbi:MAG: ribokinase [Peptostreptococcaceae bacterium]|nr:ribokinase [Peptostreptococcaceae bacterium]